MVEQSFGATYESEPPLLVWLDFEHAESQRAALIRYRSLLERAFERPVVYTHIEQSITEIRLIDRRIEQQNTPWHVSQFLIDEIPGFSLIKKAGLARRDPPLVGVIKRPYLLPYQGVRYNIDNMNVAHTMLKNRRLDLILDYSRESGYYTQLDNTLLIEELSQPRSIRVLFRYEHAADTFNQAMRTVAGIKKNTDVTLPKSEIEGEDKIFQWFLIAKQLDLESNEHIATNIDIKISLWLESQLTDYQINTDLVTLSEVKERLAGVGNVCIVNTEKTETQEFEAVYTTPTYLFLDKRMYSYQQSPADRLAKSWFAQSGTELFDLSAFAQGIPTSIFAYFEQSVGADVVARAYRDFIAAHPHRFIKIKPDAIGRSIELLDHGRIDYLIAQPFEIQQLKQRIKALPPMSSYTLKHFDAPVAQQFACSSNQAGQLLVDKINLLMSDQKSRYALKVLVGEDMLPNDRAAFVEAFDQMYLQLLSKNH